MICACIFVEHVHEPKFSFVANIVVACKVSRSSKPAAFPGFNRLGPVASSSRLKGVLSSVGGWLLL